MMKTSEKKREYMKGYQLRNKERLSEYNKLYYNRYPECKEKYRIRKAMRKIPKDTYTLTDEQQYIRSKIVQELRIQGEIGIAVRLLAMK